MRGAAKAAALAIWTVVVIYYVERLIEWLMVRGIL